MELRCHCVIQIVLYNVILPSTIRMLARLYKNDMRTVYGNNLQSITTLCEMEVSELSPRSVKEKGKYRNNLTDEEWRLPILEELIFEIITWR